MRRGEIAVSETRQPQNAVSLSTFVTCEKSIPLFFTYVAKYGAKERRRDDFLPGKFYRVDYSVDYSVGAKANNCPG